MKNKSIGMKIKIIIFIIIIFLLGCFFYISSYKEKTKKDFENIVLVSDVSNIKFKDSVLVLTKVDLDVRQRMILDVDNNKYINDKDLFIMKDIVNDKITDINKDGVIDKNDVIDLKKSILNINNKRLNKSYDLNYDGVIDDKDIDLLQRYVSNVINLDVNFDNVVNNEDINILELYLSSSKSVKILSNKKYKNSDVKFIIDNSDIADIDNNGLLTAKGEGITKLKFNIGKNSGVCDVIVVSYDKNVSKIDLGVDTIYLSPASLTTVQKSAADINKDNEINAIDLKILKEIISLKFGDVNKDGIVNDNDLKELKKGVNSHHNDSGVLDSMDLNYDGYINSKDIDLLEEYLSPNLLGDVNKDKQVEGRDIRLISEFVNSQYQFNPTISINSAFNKRLEFKSENVGIVSVTTDGHLYANKEGKTTVSVSSFGSLDKTNIVVKEVNTLPISIKNSKSKVELSYFDNNKYDISVADFNKDGLVDEKDVIIIKNLLDKKITSEDLSKLLLVIKDKKYEKNYDIDSNNLIDGHDYDILYSFVTGKKTGDVNCDGKTSQNDIDLMIKYINSFTTIKVKLKKDNVVSDVKYFSKNSNVATINNKGMIVARNKGETEIVSITVNGLMDYTKVIVN